MRERDKTVTDLSTESNTNSRRPCGQTSQLVKLEAHGDRVDHQAVRIIQIMIACVTALRVDSIGHSTCRVIFIPMLPLGIRLRLKQPLRREWVYMPANINLVDSTGAGSIGSVLNGIERIEGIEGIESWKLKNTVEC